MSRNLGRTSCHFCDSPVHLDEPPRPVTQRGGGAYYNQYQGLIVADASCTRCGTRYLAWVDGRRTQFKHLSFTPTEEYPFFDLSYRSTFDDEPSEQDFVLSPWVREQLVQGWRAQAKLERVLELLGDGE